MTDHERIIGSFEEFMRWEKQEHLHIREKLAKFDAKIDSLREWQWRKDGGLYLVSLVIGMLGGSLGGLVLKRFWG